MSQIPAVSDSFGQLSGRNRQEGPHVWIQGWDRAVNPHPGLRQAEVRAPHPGPSAGRPGADPGPHSSFSLSGAGKGSS